MKNVLTIPAEKIPRPPDKRENARLGRAGAVSQKAGGLFTTYDSRTSGKTQPLAGPRFENVVERLHRLGPRPTAELLSEIARHTGQSSFIAHRLEEYARLDRDILRALGADRFPPMPLEVVR